MGTQNRTTKVAMVALLGLLALGACGDGTDMGPSDTADASIVATVLADGGPASGVTVERYAGSGTTVQETVATSGTGEASFTGLAAGTYDVAVVAPSGFSVTGDARKTVTVADGAEATVSFSLTATSMAEPTDTVVVEAINYEFSQADLTIAPNTLVRWVNTTGTTHTVTPDGHSEWVDTSLPGMGDTFEHVFRTEGSFPYYCTPHRSFGMVGSVTVQAP